MTRSILPLALLAWAALQSPASAQPSAPDEVAAAVRAVLAAQARAWNAGDVERFMSHYWKSDRLTFSSGGKTTRGWEATLAGYKKRYPTREKMGTLTFSDLEVTALGPEAALVLGRWQLRRGADTPAGAFTLVFRKLGGRWLIVHDHTSRDAE